MRQTACMFRPTARRLTLAALALSASLGLAAAIRITVTPSVEIQPVQIQPAQVQPPQVQSAPSDPFFAQQWNLHQTGVQDAWTTLAGAAVTVAVLDTGYVQSSELAGREVNGYDFVSDASRSGDGNGRDPDASGVGALSYHAEVVANLIAAARDASGVVGVNPQARIVHVRVAGTDGLIDPQDLADAMRWAAGLSVPGAPTNPNPARILNLSLYADFVPLTGCDARIRAAVSAVTAKGALVVAGAANDGADASGYTPAGCGGVLTVTAVDRSGQRPGYANWGRAVALAAPGGSPGDGVPLWSRGELTLKNGTSFSAPLVSGVASLMLGVNPALTPATLTAMLKASVTPFPGGRCDALNPLHTCGAGIMNAGAALKLAARR